MSNVIKLVAVSIVPGLLWVAYFRKRDLYDPEPYGLIIKTFIAGAFMIIPAGIIEAPFRGFIANPPSLPILFLTNVFAIGLVEEFVKYQAVRRVVFDHPEFNEPVDGVIYAITAGLGFAAFENALYAISYGFSVGVVRAVITSLVHASFSGIIGFNMGIAKFAPVAFRGPIIWRSIMVASVLHGLYDFLLMTQMMSFPMLIGVVILLYAMLLGKVRTALKMSPFARRPFAHLRGPEAIEEAEESDESR